MKITPIFLLGLLVATSAWPSPAPLAQTTWTADQLAERTVHRRAVEAIIWGIPVVNYDLMFQSMVRDVNGGVNQILYWSGLSDWKNQYLTPKSAAQEALARFDVLYETIYEPFNKGTRWFLPADKDLTDSIESGFAKSDIYPTDGRGILFYFAYSTIKHLGAGQFYLFVSRDKDGNPLNGAETYCLHVPPKPPVRQYWSAVLYDFATHALIRDMPYASRSSQSPGLQTNTDGSVDVYFAPKVPDGKDAQTGRALPQ